MFVSNIDDVIELSDAKSRKISFNQIRLRKMNKSDLELFELMFQMTSTEVNIWKKNDSSGKVAS